jgi:hypothetical protein
MLVGLGVLAAAPTALAGASDWLTTTGAARRLGLAHALSNTGALTLEMASWLARRRGRHGEGTILSLVATGFLGVACPWHGSTFDLRTGYVVDGPASRPEPRLEVQTLDGRVRVRRPATSSRSGPGPARAAR